MLRIALKLRNNDIKVIRNISYMISIALLILDKIILLLFLTLTVSKLGFGREKGKREGRELKGIDGN